MASYEIVWKRSARKELKRLPKDIVRRVLDAVELLIEDPVPPGSRKLRGADTTFRLRVGDYRVVYSLYSHQLVIEVLRIAHRKEV